MPPASRLIRWILRLYPPAWRDRYGAEVEAFHRDERAAGAGGAGYWTRFAVDHLRAAARVRSGEGEGMMRKLMEDLANGARALRRAPTFTVFAVLTLSLGIGATTAVFSVLDRVALRPLPYPDSERMALVGSGLRHDPDTRGPLSPALLVALRADPGPAEAVVGAGGGRGVLRGPGDPERVDFTRVSPGFFEFFGARASLGRVFDATDHAPGAPRTVVLGHAEWRERFGGDPGAVGRTLQLDGEIHTVVGVLDPDFIPPPELTDGHGLWVSLHLSEGEPATGSFFIAGVARMASGASLDDLQAHGSRLVRDVYAAGDGPSFISGAVVRDYRSEVVGEIAETLGRVLGAVGLLLLIACVNVASLLLTRGAERTQEMAVRAALGAGRGRLVRQLLAESALLALVGGAVGSAMAYGAVELFRRLAPGGLPRLAEVAVDGRGLAFALALGGATVLVFGLLPALRSAAASGPGAGGLTRRAATAGRREGRIRGALVATETALVVVLAVGSALLARDLIRMATLDPGFRADGVAALRLSLSPRYEREEWTGVWEQLLEGARTLPGVTSAAVSSQVPFTGDRIASSYRPQHATGEDAEGVFVITLYVAGDYLGTLGGGMVEGRPLGLGDDAGAPVALVNEAFVRRYWPGRSGVGRLVRSGAAGIEDEPEYEVVGVVADMVTRPGRDAAPRVLLPMAAHPWHDMEVLVRTEGDAAALAPGLRALVQRFDPALPVTSVRTVSSLGREALVRPRFYTVLFGAFAGIALLLAVVGVYGTTAYATRSRTREIGIRMALGAVRSRVVAGVVARTGSVVCAGVVLGLGGAWFASRAMGDVLHHVPPRDALSYGFVAAVVLGAGVVAAWIPAGRAGRVDPAETLREEG